VTGMPLWPAGHFSRAVNMKYLIGSSKLLRSNNFAVKPGWPGAVRVGQKLLSLPGEGDTLYVDTRRAQRLYLSFSN
jgi:hypothetical protein